MTNNRKATVLYANKWKKKYKDNYETSVINKGDALEKRRKIYSFKGGHGRDSGILIT